MLPFKPAVFYISIEIDLYLIPERLRWFVAYFLNLVRWCYINWKADEWGFVRLKATYIHRIIPPKLWLEVRDFLCNGERYGQPVIVEFDRHYIEGKQSLGYRLVETYRKTHKVICTDEKLNRRINRVYRKSSILLPVHDCLFTTSAHAEYVKVVMKESFVKVGAYPTLRQEEQT